MFAMETIARNEALKICAERNPEIFSRRSVRPSQTGLRGFLAYRRAMAMLPSNIVQDITNLEQNEMETAFVKESHKNVPMIPRCMSSPESECPLTNGVTLTMRNVCFQNVDMPGVKPGVGANIYGLEDGSKKSMTKTWVTGDMEDVL